MTTPPPSMTKTLLCFSKKDTPEANLITPDLTPVHSANSSASSSDSSSTTTKTNTTKAQPMTLSATRLEDNLSQQENDINDEEEPPSLRLINKPITNTSTSVHHNQSTTKAETVTTNGGGAGRGDLPLQQNEPALPKQNKICIPDDENNDLASHSQGDQGVVSWSGNINIGSAASSPHYSPATESIFSTPRAGCGAAAAGGRNTCTKRLVDSAENPPPMLPPFGHQDDHPHHTNTIITTNGKSTTKTTTSSLLQMQQCPSRGGVQLSFSPQPFPGLSMHNCNSNSNCGVMNDHYSPLPSGEIIIMGKTDKKSSSHGTIATANDDISTLGFEVASSVVNFNMTDSELMDKRHGSPGQLRLTEAGLEEHTKKQTEEIMMQSKQRQEEHHRFKRNNNNNHNYNHSQTIDMKGYHEWKRRQEEKKFYRDKHEQRDLKLETRFMEQQQAEAYGSDDVMASSSDLVVPLGLEPPPKATTNTTMDTALNHRTSTATRTAVTASQIIQLSLPNRVFAPPVKEKGVELLSLEPMNCFDPNVFEYTPAPGRPSPFGLLRIRKKKTPTSAISLQEQLRQQERMKQQNAETEKKRLEQEEFDRIQKRREEYLIQQRALEALVQEEKKKGENKHVVRKVVVVEKQSRQQGLLRSMKNTKQHSMRVLVPPSEPQSSLLATVKECNNFTENDDEDEESFHYHHYNTNNDEDSSRRRRQMPLDTKILSTSESGAMTSTSSCAGESTFTLDTKASTEPCVICTEGERTHIAMPCMHYSFCEDCVSTMECRGIKTCPCCKAKNTSFTKVFF